MPFGKHRGQHVANLPPQYLSWLTGNVDLKDPLKSAVWRALGADMMTVGPDASRIKSVYRTLSLRWHPDRGGTHEAMQALNDFYELLTASTWA